MYGRTPNPRHASGGAHARPGFQQILIAVGVTVSVVMSAAVGFVVLRAIQEDA
ncbi:hypothetical protein [Nonomuraea sp. bgisy094]|uniref:hypothetical protein n=1 Tax=Nonomuraea sp. bgisy094 TaxID=3413781 RepID=UPI003EBC7CFB